MAKKKYDFGGYATKIDLKCSDGRTIRKNAFKDNDGDIVPLVWQHVHNDPTNVLGHALLENREDGVYAYCAFNKSANAKHAKELVEHGDITQLSIHANELQQKGQNVLHGVIREVSLVLAGANPGAFITNLEIEHGDGTYDTDNSEAIIFTGEDFTLGEMEHADDDDSEDDKTVQEVFDTLNDEQKNVVYALISHALGGDEDDDEEDNEDVKHSQKGGKEMKKNVFDQTDDNKAKPNTLTHEQFGVILGDAMKMGSFKNAILAHATEYGIENIDILFPDAKNVNDPQWLERETGWVKGVLDAIHHSPFSRIKSTFFDMDFDTARAKGYIKGTEKKEVYLSCSKRETTPTTVYVKQKLDRDDITDVTDMDIVEMARRELRVLLNEELAVAALVGDGRTLEDEYKIKEDKIRPIWTDDALFSVKETLSSKTDYAVIIEEIALSGEHYKGSGSPKFYTTNYHHMKMLWVKDSLGHRLYPSDAELCSAMGVSGIVEVPALVAKTRTVDGKVHELIGMKMNLSDYTFGADKGGQIASFDDFDIDFNQYKYLLETRCSGALTKAYSAQIYEYIQPAG